MTDYQSGLGNGYRLLVSVAATSQNSAAKTTTVSWVVSVRNPSSNYFSARITGNLAIGGSNVWSVSGSSFNSAPSGSTKVIASGSKVYNHDANGKLNLSVSAGLRTDSQGSSWSVPQLSLSGTFSAPSFSVLPIAPTDIAFWTNDNARTVLAETASVPGATEYSIERRTGSGSWVSTSTTSRRIEFPGAAAPVSYTFRSRARNSIGWGPYSSEKTFVVKWGPSKLGVPSLSQNVETRAITVTSPVADAYGTPIVRYQIMRRDNSSGAYGGWTYLDCDSSRKIQFIPPIPDTGYAFRARAMSESGEWKESSESDTTLILGLASGPKLKHAGVWKQTQAYVRHNGVWKKAISYHRSGGTWKQTRR